MKKLYFIVSLSFILITILFVNDWWTEILRWIVNRITLVFSAILKGLLLSTGTIGTGFNALVDVCANHPEVWESVSTYFLSLPPKAQMSCPPGFVTVPNKSHSPSSNGCGDDDLKIDTKYLAYVDQELCCNSHDKCYDQCHVFLSTDMDLYRTRCDLDFKSCLDRICTFKSWQRSLVCPFYILLTSNFWNENCEQPLRSIKEKKCKASVEVLYKSVYSWGINAYIKAQTQACICVPEDSCILGDIKQPDEINLILSK